ncbi:MAG: CDP-alcohol phosphatidyltransferase family protein [Oscillospiraceae bacterium]|nr:CDP-alcohol phosphatidyltransferase family protein [Oscillospiraceae bacterium]
MKRNIPNILSAIRIALVPVFIGVYFACHETSTLYAAAIYALATFTDFLDGYIARKYNLITNLGRVLDPLGDKLMTIAVLSCITIDKIIPVWMVLVVLVKELLMLSGGIVIHKVGKVEMPPSNYIGKSSTVVFFVVCITLMIFRSIPEGIATTMVLVALALMLMALGSYIMTFFATMKKAREGE